MQGTVVAFQHLSLNDGPGIRTIAFLKGCPLHCAWCHNPEMIKGTPELSFSQQLCICCGACVSACPNGCHSSVNRRHELRREGCIACGMCAEVCPSALELKGQSMTAKAVADILLADRVFYESSGGGITLSGGEPLMQPAFTEEILGLCHAAGVHTCIESCCFAEWEQLAPLLPLTNLFLCDWKLTNDDLHRRFTGVSNAKIRDNLIRLSESGAHIRLRCPIIPGINDHPAHFSGIAELANRLRGIERVELLPYHDIWRQKAAAFGLQNPNRFATPSAKESNAWVAALQGMTEKEVTLG